MEHKYKPMACQECGLKGMKVPIKKDVTISFGYLFCKRCGSDHVYTVNHGRVEFDIDLPEDKEPEMGKKRKSIKKSTSSTSKARTVRSMNSMKKRKKK